MEIGVHHVNGFKLRFIVQVQKAYLAGLELVDHALVPEVVVPLERIACR